MPQRNQNKHRLLISFEARQHCHIGELCERTFYVPLCLKHLLLLHRSLFLFQLCQMCFVLFGRKAFLKNAPFVCSAKPGRQPYAARSIATCPHLREGVHLSYLSSQQLVNCCGDRESAISGHQPNDLKERSPIRCRAKVLLPSNAYRNQSEMFAQAGYNQQAGDKPTSLTTTIE
jgi:hypothetical protein